jgi:transcription elongation factor Elf1
VKKLGRRRRRVVHIPKKRLPKFFDCPECGKTNTIGIHFSQQKPEITVRCGECGQQHRKDFLEYKEIRVKCENEDCPNYKQEIVRIRRLPEHTIMTECGKCHRRNVLALPLNDEPINCSCELSRQVKIKTDPARRFARVMCGNCGLRSSFRVDPSDESVDVYGKFLDRYYGKS